MYENAEKAESDAKAMQNEYEEKLEKANDESEQIVRSAVRRAQLREEEILREANDKAERVMQRAEEQIEREKKQAINDVKDQVSDMAVEIAGAIIMRDGDASEHSDMIDDFISNIGN